MAPPPPQVPADEARRRADEVLSRAEFQEPEPSLVDRALDALGEALADAIQALAGGGPGSMIALVVIGLLVAAAVWFLVRSIGAGPGGRLPVAGPATRQRATELDDPERWRARAEQLEAGGDLRGALRCRYREGVARLVTERAVGDQPGRTPRELSRELAARQPAVADDASAVAERFESVWFGGAAVTADELARFRADLTRIVDAGRHAAHDRSVPTAAGASR